MGSLLSDIRYAVRSLRRRPLLTLAAVTSLALGIGVNTSIFSLVDRMVLRKLAVPAPNDIVLLSAPGRKPGGTTSGDSGLPDQVFSLPLFRDLERLSGTGLSRIVAHRDIDVSLGSRGTSAPAHGLIVSGSYFSVLNVGAAVGRVLISDDDRVPGAHPVVVLAHHYWTTRFGSDRQVVGESLAVNGRPFTIVGVAAPGFTGTTLMDRPDVFVPLSMAQEVAAGGKTRRDHWLYLFARLQPGFTRAHAQQAINGPFTQLIRGIEFDELRSGLTEQERPAFLQRQLFLVDGSRSRQQHPDQVQQMLALVMAVTALVLLIACANVANLLMARAVDRASEIAIRTSMGASRSVLVRLLLIEAVLLGAAGSFGSLLVAFGTSRALLEMMPAADAVPLQFELNRSVLLFAMLAGMVTSTVFGLYPAVYGVQRTTVSPLQGTRASATRGATRFRTSLATAQIALATALLATAALFAASLGNVASTSVGLDRTGLVAFRVAAHLNGYDQARTRDVFDRLIAGLRELPGVSDATATSIPVLADEGWNQKVTVEGAEGATIGEVSTARIDTDYFTALRVPILVGREFRWSDSSDSPRVAIVNRAFVSTFNLDREAVGRRLALGAGERRVSDIEIVGIVENAKYSNVRDEPPPQLYLPYRQSPVGPMTFYARATSDVDQVKAAVPALLARLDPNLPADHLQTLDEQIWENVTRDRVMAGLSSWFAFLAALLAGVGLYGLLAFTVAQRMKEFGIRMALGATPRDVAVIVGRHVGRMALVGTPIGIAAAVALARLGESLLYGVSGHVPLLISGAAAGMLIIMMLAAAVPARRAMTVAPSAALHTE
jgi:putative ABC transport system permease protein